MKKIYVDFDGVILNSNKIVGRLIYENVRNTENENEVHSYMKTVDWDKIISEAIVINDSLMWLNKLAKTYEVTVLSHVSSVDEMSYKINYVRNFLPMLDIICVPKLVKKVDMFSRIKGTYLIDDFARNTAQWNENGGIGILFSLKKGTKKYCNQNFVIDCLEELYTIVEGVKDETS